MIRKIILKSISICDRVAIKFASISFGTSGEIENLGGSFKKSQLCFEPIHAFCPQTKEPEYVPDASITANLKSTCISVFVLWNIKN